MAERYLAAHLFGPAGMHDTGYVLPQWETDQLAVEYDRRGVAQGGLTIIPGLPAVRIGTCAATAA